MFALILVLGSLPGAREDLGQYASGLVLHSVAYAVLGVLVFLGSSGSGSGFRIALEIVAWRWQWRQSDQ